MAINESRAEQRQQKVTNSRQVWIALMVLTAAVVGIVAGFLAHASGINPPAAVLAGGGAFGTSILILLAIAHYLGGEHR